MAVLIFDILCIIILVVVISRRIDLFSIAAVCLIVYNYYCTQGYVWIASHERYWENYYEGAIDPIVYGIVIVQLLIMLVVIRWYDARGVAGPSRTRSQKYTEVQLDAIFRYAGIVSMLIMLSNVAAIGVSGLSAAKSTVWTQTNLLYITSLWLAMGVFAYSIKNSRYTYLLLCLPQILIHLYIGSRAYFAVVCIVALVCISARGSFTVKKNVLLLCAGFLLMMAIMLYKQIFEEVKAGDIAAIVSILQNPDTYNWIFRWGEPRIVLANFNYVVTNDVTLSTEEIIGRFISVIPFLNNFFDISEHDLLLSTVVGGDLNSSYGLASNIWGEFYVIGSFPLVAIMYIGWIAMLIWGNKIIKDEKWTSTMLLPLISYFAFYIHRMDLVKVLGNIKMVLMAMIIWWIIACVVTRVVSFGMNRRLHKTNSEDCGTNIKKHREP